MKDGNILENMEEFGRAMDDGKEVEFYGLSEWVGIENDWALDSIFLAIKSKYLRIKPETLTTYYRVYRTVDRRVCRACGPRPFPDFERWLHDRNWKKDAVFIKDFEVTE